MAIPVWAVGQVLTASDVNNWLVPTAVYKTADEPVTSSAALQNDDELFVAVAANAEYKFTCWVEYIGAAGGDIKWAWSFPTGTTMRYNCLHNEGGTITLNNSHTIYAETDTGAAACTTSVLVALHMTGRVSTGSSSGTLQFRWAQNTSNASATHVRNPSYIELQRLG